MKTFNRFICNFYYSSLDLFISHVNSIAYYIYWCERKTKKKIFSSYMSTIDLSIGKPFEHSRKVVQLVNVSRKQLCRIAHFFNPQHGRLNNLSESHWITRCSEHLVLHRILILSHITRMCFNFPTDLTTVA